MFIPGVATGVSQLMPQVYPKQQPYYAGIFLRSVLENPWLPYLWTMSPVIIKIPSQFCYWIRVGKQKTDSNMTSLCSGGIPVYYIAHLQHQCQNSTVTTALSQQHCHNSVTTTGSQQQCHNRCHNKCHNNSVNKSVTTAASQQQCHKCSVTKVVSQQQCHNNSVTVTMSQ